MATSSAALSLRDSFGDRKPPDISRKITACVACRKQKIKCHLNGNPPCSRCKSRGLPCTVNKSLQMLLESDAGWKEEMEERLRKLEDALTLNTNHRDNLAISTSAPYRTSPAPDSPIELSNSVATLTTQASENTSDVTLNLSCSLGSFPGSSIISLTFTEQGTQSKNKPDLVSSGLVSLEAAEAYFTVYQKSMEPCTPQILLENDCLANVRARSSLLTAALCTAGSLGADSASHKRCYDAFLQEVSSRLFSRHHSIDDVRAVCIGALWLNKVSSMLIGMAVRMANDLSLHRCITKMPHSKSECYERTRLYFLVYICDHQCFLIYGKPPMTREFHSLKSPKSFLQSPHCIPADEKLISQVELWSISSRVFDIFGADVEASITPERVAELESLSRSFDLCRSALPDSMPMDDHSDVFARQLFDLQIHCAKLSLFSHSFRGSSQRHARSPLKFDGKERFERSALESALSIVRSIACETELQQRLEWLPSYFGTMIAFASISLMKASEKEQTMCYLDKNEVSSALSCLVEVFNTCSARVQPEHPLRSVARSLRIAMNSFCQSGVNHVDPLANGMLAFDDIGNSWGMDYLGDYNNLLSLPNDVDAGFMDLQNL
ncbi:uncharacterized protein LY89DRAFT_105896 [Mollisia scopiformis]|uniref:Zn(2)-C6 fungal-type domain-containing protein n=1 Tax=Mollisia scopiformis TaxID=149040 RepID=A0A194X4R7_MOLSC|nr:uncharacterized protein LY89DRAFT_105896 [Mollisia scopiformis]KUJ15173.1 hypothetical protein LY89DRAFT_105896 [Mollisia scopiformis]